ncbi:MAG: hypothetical protein K9L86_00135 [Candidatus Omnitrophica bacterium]|nr:hypothetical protein [Candidatus Omnitrophota bacterium]
MSSRKKVLILLVVLVSLFLVSSSQAYAGIWDKFSRWETFNGLSKFKNDSTSPFKKLTETNKKLDSTNPSFSKLASMSFKLSESLKPSFAKMALINGGLSHGLRPSFSKLESLKGLDSGIKPSFAKMDTITSGLAGTVKPSFVKLATLNTNLAGSLKPSFERMGEVNINNKLNPQLVKLTTINKNITGGLNSNFERLGNVNSKVAPSLSPAFSTLASISPKLSSILSPKLQALTKHKTSLVEIGKTHALYTKPKGLKTIRLTAKKPISFAPIATSPELSRLSISPEILQGLSATDVAELITRDLHLIQPISGSKQLLPPIQIGPQNVSLMSILSIEIK